MTTQGVIFLKLIIPTQGYHKGTIAMMCIAALLLAWIGLVAWRDKTTLQQYELEMAQIQTIAEEKREELEMEEKDMASTVQAN